MPRSLSARLSFWIVLASAMLFLGLILHLAKVFNVGIHKEVDKDAVQVLDNAVLRVDDILDDVRRGAYTASWFVLRDLDEPDMMVPYSNAIVRYNLPLNSCSISFEPWFYQEKGEYYSIFSWRTPDGEIRWEQEGDDEYRYFENDWYRKPKQEKTDSWTEPYCDHTEEDDPMMDTRSLISFCKPMYTADSSFVGVVSLDLSLRRLSEELSDVKPYANAYCIMTGKDGKYLVHPDVSKLMYYSIFSDAEELSNPELAELGEAMGRLEEGKRVISLDGENYYIFFQPIPTTGWSMAIFYPESDIFGGYHKLQRNLLMTIIGVLMLMFFMFVWLIRRQLAPLGKLAEEADFIASGNFDRTLPPVRHNDEIGMLSRSFKHMQSSLVQQIKQLTETTASRERMEKELQIARNIQMGMVPHDFNLGSGIDLNALMMPAREVGGDLYDFFVQDGKLYLCIGDVSGKGVPASLFMAVSRGMFRILARQGLSPAEIARSINDTVAEKNEQMVFVTMFIAAVDLSSGQMDFCNCGHNAPVLLHGDTAEFLECKPNTAVGILPDFAYEGQRVDLKDKVLFLYTDGLNEAENAAHEQFGNDQMLAALSGEPFTDAKSVVQRLCRAVNAHVGGAAASDDLTMLCLKLTPDSPAERR